MTGGVRPPTHPFATNAVVSRSSDHLALSPFLPSAADVEGGSDEPFADEPSSAASAPQPVDAAPPGDKALSPKRSSGPQAPGTAGSIGASVHVGGYRHITAVPYAEGCWKAQVGDCLTAEAMLY